MFNAVTSHENFKRNILAVSSITTEALFVAKNDGIYFHGMDSSHVAMALIDWPSSDFESYNCDSDVRIGVQIDTLSKIIKRMSSKLDVEISVNNDSNMMTLKSGSTSFTIRLLDVNEQERKIPQIDTTVEFTISVAEFAKIIGDVEVTTHHIDFKASGSKLSFTGKGDDSEAEIESDIVIVCGDGYKNEATSSYSLEYLKPFISDMKGDMTVKFADNKPVIIECGHATFFLAPRIGE